MIISPALFVVSACQVSDVTVEVLLLTVSTDTLLVVSACRTFEVTTGSALLLAISTGLVLVSVFISPFSSSLVFRSSGLMSGGRLLVVAGNTFVRFVPIPVFLSLSPDIVKEPLPTPLKATASVALMVTLPAFPCPNVLLLIPPPPVTDIEAVSIRMLPAFPFATSVAVLLKIPLADNSIDSLKIRDKFPALPFPKVLLLNTASLVRNSALAMMFIFPPSPIALSPTMLKIPLENL